MPRCKFCSRHQSCSLCNLGNKLINVTEELGTGMSLQWNRPCGYKLLPHVIESIISTEYSLAEHVYIPRIHVTPSVAEIPFVLGRLQFPLRLCSGFPSLLAWFRCVIHLTYFFHFFLILTNCVYFPFVGIRFRGQFTRRYWQVSNT